MNARIKYCVEFAKVSKLPDFQRIRAETRFTLIKEYEYFLRREAAKLGHKFKVYRAAKIFFALQNIPETTFYRWLRTYKKNGIEGLVPHYRSQPDDTSINTSLSSNKKRHKDGVLRICLDISTDNPLSCLPLLEKAITTSPLIASDVKDACATSLYKINRLVLRKTPMKLATPLTLEEIEYLETCKAGKHRRQSIRATAVLMMNEGRTMLDIGLAVNATDNTIYKWLATFKTKRTGFVKVTVNNPVKRKEIELRTTRVIDIIHKMPSLYGINRTTWTYGAISDAYQKEYKSRISTSLIQRVIKRSGCTWRRIRNVQTSPDPDYKAKVEKLLDTLQGLKEGERFFFIDEVGPYRVRKYGGKVLLPKDQPPEELPEHQKSRGKIQFVAALEAVTNQLIWLFTPDKGAVSMVELLKKTIKNYADSPAIYLTWDAISVHSSKLVTSWIAEHNISDCGPHIEVVPLPSNAQFLNVIEAVFCGMKKAVICNSDYPSEKDMQEAIARHFEERNQFYRDNPKRAGNKIWDKQKFDFDKLAGGLFKKM